MQNVLSKRRESAGIPRIRLNAIWYVEADATYSINKRDGSPPGFVAVRTLSGQGDMTLRSGITFSLLADSLAIFEKKEIMHYAAAEIGWQFYWFEFCADDWILLLLNRTDALAIHSQERSELEQCFLRLNRGDIWETMASESLFAYLLANWQIRITQASDADEKLWNVLSLLEKGRRERMSIAELAQEAGMCERSFRKAVHEATGLSPKAYILKSEMAAAMELLRTTDMTVTEIAYSFRYSSPFYFSRIFKRYQGISPQQVRDRKER